MTTNSESRKRMRYSSPPNEDERRGEAVPREPSSRMLSFPSVRRFVSARFARSPPEDSPMTSPKALTLYELLVVLRPFFWPHEGTDGALVNRVRAISTWVVVGISKACNVYSPFFLQNTVNQLVSGNRQKAFQEFIAYVLLVLAGSVFNQLQSVLYIRVNQQASIELQEYTFSHIHSLSLNWHLTKKTGTVIRVMDRGTSAANTLVTYLFLYLLPALAQCLSVVILFFAQYKQWAIGVLVAGGVALYGFLTIRITIWRAKFRYCIRYLSENTRLYYLETRPTPMTTTSTPSPPTPF